jgi:hypothetical protein
MMLGTDKVLYMAGGFLLLSTFPEYGVIQNAHNVGDVSDYTDQLTVLLPLCTVSCPRPVGL